MICIADTYFLCFKMEKRLSGHVACIGRRGVYRNLVGKCEGKRTFGNPMCRWKDNIKMDLHQLGSGFMDWIDLARIGSCDGHL